MKHINHLPIDKIVEQDRKIRKKEKFKPTLFR